MLKNLGKKLAFVLKACIMCRPCKCADSHRALFCRDPLEGVRFRLMVVFVRTLGIKLIFGN